VKPGKFGPDLPVMSEIYRDFDEIEVPRSE